MTNEFHDYIFNIDKELKTYLKFECKQIRLDMNKSLTAELDIMKARLERFQKVTNVSLQEFEQAFLMNKQQKAKIEKFETLVGTPFEFFTKRDWTLRYIESYGSIDGEHHKAWILDQIARISHGQIPTVKLVTWKNNDGLNTCEWRFHLSSEKSTKSYHEWVKEMRNGEDGTDTYHYDIGIAP